MDAYDDPNIASDLTVFDQTFGLPRRRPSSRRRCPTLRASVRSPTRWAGEISLDVEWAHAIAPKANILLVEAATSSWADLTNAVDYARNQPGVSVVSMSWGGGELAGETVLRFDLHDAGRHGGVMFVASSGDSGAGAEWPAVSPNVLAVGGTSLTITTAAAYTVRRAGAAAAAAPASTRRSRPTRSAVSTAAKRTSPDVAYNADPNTGFYVYDTVADSQGNVGWFAYGGTSAGAPQWAALIALADQGRAAAGLGALTNAGAGRSTACRRPTSTT